MLVKRLALAAVPLSILLAGCSSAPASSEQSCAVPQTKVAPTRAAPGQAVTVSAADMWDGCNDQGANQELLSLKDQPVTMTVGGKAVVMGHVSADPDTGLARTRVTIPAVAKVGKVVLKLGIAEPVELTVTAG